MSMNFDENVRKYYIFLNLMMDFCEDLLRWQATNKPVRSLLSHETLKLETWFDQKELSSALGTNKLFTSKFRILNFLMLSKLPYGNTFQMMLRCCPLEGVREGTRASS